MSAFSSLVRSWANAVITEAGSDPKVAGLVYVAAFAPDANQNITEISTPFPPPPGLGMVKPLTEKRKRKEQVASQKVGRRRRGQEARYTLPSAFLEMTGHLTHRRTDKC